MACPDSSNRLRNEALLSGLSNTDRGLYRQHKCQPQGLVGFVLYLEHITVKQERKDTPSRPFAISIWLIVELVLLVGLAVYAAVASQYGG